jgi:hypothetical protein
MPSAHVSSPPYNEDEPGYYDNVDDPEEESSAGTSSSTSGKKQDKSGSSGTHGHRSLVQDAENRFEPVQPANRAPSSSASSMAGSTPETGQSQPDQPDSSGDSAAEMLATADPHNPVSVADQKAAGVPTEETVTMKEQEAGEEAPVVPDALDAQNAEDEAAADEAAEDDVPTSESLMAKAHKAFDDEEFDEAEKFLAEALKLDSNLFDEIVRARTAISTAKLKKANED